MTISELINELEKIEDKNKIVEVRNCDGYDEVKEIYIDIFNDTVIIDS